LISALLKGWWRTIADAIEAGRLELAASPAAIEEFRDVAGRPRVQRLVAPEDADGIADLLGRAVLAATRVTITCWRWPWRSMPTFW
jgi:predicted nucleic acid-binding protein